MAYGHMNMAYEFLELTLFSICLGGMQHLSENSHLKEKRQWKPEEAQNVNRNFSEKEC